MIDSGIIIPSFQINLSTTSKGPDALSPVFAQNVGGDDATVRSARTLIFSGNCGATPEPFAPAIVFDIPFFYNPSGGNLLLDIRNYGAVGNSSGLFLDGANTMGDSISHVQGFNVDDPVAVEMNSFGFVAQFRSPTSP